MRSSLPTVPAADPIASASSQKTMELDAADIEEVLSRRPPLPELPFDQAAPVQPRWQRSVLTACLQVVVVILFVGYVTLLLLRLPLRALPRLRALALAAYRQLSNAWQRASQHGRARLYKQVGTRSRRVIRRDDDGHAS